MNIPQLEWAIALIFIAAFIRGYTGFGFAAFAIMGLNLIWPAQMSIPIILLLDLISSLSLIPKAWGNAERKLVRRLSTGMLVGIPLGLTLLIQVSDTTLKVFISLMVLGFALILLFHSSARMKDSIFVKSQPLMGAVSGAFTAAASVGGLPVVCYLMATHLQPAQQRASMIIFLSASSGLSLISMAYAGILSKDLLLPVLILILPALIGVQIGHIFFLKRPPVSFRPIVLPLLMVLSSCSLGMNIWEWS